MNKAEIQPFIDKRPKAPKGKALEAIRLHFCQGFTVAEAAEQAGISRANAEYYIGPLRLAVIKAGWQVHYSKRITYRKPK